MPHGRDLTPNERDVLETLIDACTLRAVMEALSEICDEKAEHIRTNYGQHDRDAKNWAHACGVLGVASTTIAAI